MINEECVITDENLDWSNFNANIQFLEEIGLLNEKVRILHISDPVDFDGYRIWC